MLFNMVLPGAVEAARLPAEYQEVKYIESTGTQYIDTGYVVNASDTISWEFIAMVPAQSEAYMGADGYMQFHVTSNGVGVSTLNASGLGSKKTFRIDFSNSVTQLYIDNTLVETKNWAGSYTGTNVKLGIFRLGIANNAWHASIGLVSCTLYEYAISIGGEIASHCIPCYRKADNSAGVYDIINNVFRGNLGTGNFAVGPNVNANDVFSYTGNYTDNRTDGTGTVRLNSSGIMTVLKSMTVSLTVVGGGGGGAYTKDYVGGASGGGGGNQTVEVELAPGTYEIVIGTGGATSISYNGPYVVTAPSGGDTTAFGYTSTGGDGGAVNYNTFTAGTGGTPNGANGSTGSHGGNVIGGSPNGGGFTTGTFDNRNPTNVTNGGNGYVELTFS